MAMIAKIPIGLLISLFLSFPRLIQFLSKWLSVCISRATLGWRGVTQQIIIRGDFAPRSFRYPFSTDNSTIDQHKWVNINEVAEGRQNRLLPSSKNPHFQNEARCTTFLVKMSFICMRMKNDFHIKGWALNLVLKQRPGGTRKWPINPLSPNMHKQILQTDLYTFPYRISWEKLIKDQSFFSLWSFD